jgi:putative ABC transport system permease protein
MFSIDFWQEILYTINTNKLRTGLTGFSVAWGIFILILLLGTGNGLQNGVRAQFSRGAVNSMWISSFRTSRPYNGLPEGRPIVFHNDDYEALKKIKEIEAITGRYDEGAWGERSVMQYKENYGVFEMCSCHPDQAIADQINMDQGRFVNQIDIEQIRKTAAITDVVKEALFKNEDPLGKYISVRGVPFKVVGVFRDASELNSRRIYIPITTRQRVFNGGNRIAFFGITVIDMTSDRIGKTETAIREYFAKKYNFDPQDARAIHINDVFKEYKKYMDLFSTLRTAVWIAGIMTIIAGIMGVGN